jgi:Zn-dependent protease with chaperone function
MTDRPKDGTRARRVLDGIDPRAWEHPADRAALNAVRKVPGFDVALRKVFGIFGERSLRLAFQANAVQVTEVQYPWIHERLQRVCRVLDVETPPELYVSQDPVANAGALGMDDPFIVLNSSMVEVLSPDELEAVLGHEVGHVLSGHALYRTLLVLLLRLSLFRYPLAGVAARPVLYALLEWYRKSELSADRAGLLAVQDPEASMGALMQLAGGARGEALDLDAFVEQSRRYREDDDVLDSVYKALNVLGSTHPFAVARVAELEEWIESGAYERILTGEYPHRDEEDDRPYREDLAEAMSGYTDSARELFDQVDAAVDRLRRRVSEAWRREPGFHGEDEGRDGPGAGR